MKKMILFLACFGSSMDAGEFVKSIVCHLVELENGRCYAKMEELCPEGFEEIARDRQFGSNGETKMYIIDFRCKKVYLDKNLYKN